MFASPVPIWRESARHSLHTLQFEVDETLQFEVCVFPVVKKTNPSFLNGVPEMLILRLLSRREMYGYEIVRTIQSDTNEIFSFGEGCIYPYLHYLEKEKLVSSTRKEVEGRSRNYYLITARGKERLKELAGEWNRVASGISLVMGVQHA